MIPAPTPTVPGVLASPTATSTRVAFSLPGTPCSEANARLDSHGQARRSSQPHPGHSILPATRGTRPTRCRPLPSGRYVIQDEWRSTRAGGRWKARPHSIAPQPQLDNAHDALTRPHKPVPGYLPLESCPHDSNRVAGEAHGGTQAGNSYIDAERGRICRPRSCQGPASNAAVRDRLATGDGQVPPLRRAGGHGRARRAGGGAREGAVHVLRICCWRSGR